MEQKDGDEDLMMVNFETEADETLAELARCYISQPSQAMYLELSGKTADVSEENENFKKEVAEMISCCMENRGEKENAVMHYNLEAEVSNSSRSMSMANVYGATSQFTSPPVTLGCNGDFQANNANAISASTEHIMRSKKSLVNEPVDSTAACKARRKRKELMKLKNLYCAHDSLRY